METENQRSIGSDGWAELHSDLMSIILIQLDVKTLSSCRFVCKTWNRVIWSRGFINAHRRQSISRGLSDILFIHFEDRKSSESDGLWKFTMVNPAETYHTIINNTNSINLRRMNPLDVTCDLLCFVDFKGGSFMLCNPRTGQVQTLPKPPIACHYRRHRLVFGYVDSTRQYVLVGLYEDNVLENYKMLKFNFSSNYECESHGDRSCSCSIASSSWKEIEDACPLRRGRPGILVNNSVYWFDYDRGIVSLELENDKYKIISCPPQFKLPYPTLIDLKGTLAVGRRDTRYFDIWVLDQFNNCSHSCGWVWKYKYSINLANILGPENWSYEVYSKSSRNGELIVTTFLPYVGLTKHYVCNPEKGNFRALTDPCSGALGMGFFWESLSSFGVKSY